MICWIICAAASVSLPDISELELTVEMCIRDRPDSSCIGSYIYAAKKQGKYKQGGLLPACHLYRIIYFYRQSWKMCIRDRLERIREIRASERMFYQKITDLYATAIDYDKEVCG